MTMGKNIDIDLLEEDFSRNTGVSIPSDFETEGRISDGDLRIYINKDTYRRIDEFSASDLYNELGSILIGQYSEENGERNLIISNYIEAKYTNKTASTLTFTHKTWDYIHEKREAVYPEKKIVGWQHTHPGFGVFLSGYDIFIQENFFDLPFQTAYVIDPVRRERGFFQWKNGKIKKLNGFYIYTGSAEN